MKTSMIAAALLAGILASAGLALRPSPLHAAERAPAPPATAAPAGKPLPEMVVHKHASCGCCAVWIEHMRQAGFRVSARNEADMSPVKQAAGVPQALGSCHTAQVGGYFVEGHVPAQDVLRLLRERPKAKGLAVPGMPMGSPGMEHPAGIVQPYAVLLMKDDGGVEEFSRHGPRD